MFYLIISGIVVMCFIFGFIIVSLLTLLLRRKKIAAASNENQSIIQLPHLVTQPPAQSMMPKKEEDKPLFFTLSRSDVFDHVLEMGLNGERFPIKIIINEKINEKMPDFLSVGKWCFGIMFARNEIVFSFVLQMSEEMAKALSARFSLEKIVLAANENWYNLTIDYTFISKNEVYAIIDDCCEYTLREGIRKKRKDNAETSIEAMRAECAELEKKMAENMSTMEKTIAAAETEYRAKLEKYKTENYSKLFITRKEIANYTRGLKNPNLTVAERPEQPQLPMSLKYKENTYAMLHAIDEGVLMIVRIPGEYAFKLSLKHPEICRTKFPRGEDWYQLPADGAFKSKKEVFELLDTACEFVKTKIDTKKTNPVRKKV